MELYTFLWIILLFSAIMMIGCTNPVYATLFMINVFINSSIILILLNVDYMGLIFLMVYVGAIAILFLFVVMMIPMKQTQKDNTRSMTVGLFFFFLVIFCLYNQTSQSVTPLNNYDLQSSLLNFYYHSEYVVNSVKLNNFSFIGFILFRDYFSLLFISGLTLLIAMIGAIFLTNEQKGVPGKKQLSQTHRIYEINITEEIKGCII